MINVVAHAGAGQPGLNRRAAPVRSFRCLQEDKARRLAQVQSEGL